MDIHLYDTMEFSLNLLKSQPEISKIALIFAEPELIQKIDAPCDYLHLADAVT